MARSRVQRRNTMDCAILNQMFIDEESKKSDKRAQALLREAERDMKQSMVITSATNYHSRGSAMFMNAERLESIAASPRNSGVPTLVESCNRYMSVSSRPVGCRSSAPPTAFLQNLKLDLIDSKKLKPRKEFHETFANLIKLGSTDRQDIKVRRFLSRIKGNLPIFLARNDSKEILYYLSPRTKNTHGKQS